MNAPTNYRINNSQLLETDRLQLRPITLSGFNAIVAKAHSTLDDDHCRRLGWDLSSRSVYGLNPRHLVWGSFRLNDIVASGLGAVVAYWLNQQVKRAPNKTT